MLSNLAVGSSVMAFCLICQSYMLMVSIRFYANNHKWIETPGMTTRMTLLITVMLLMVLGNLVQVGVWGFLFYCLGEFQTFSTAFYFSAVNFATLGYGDIVMSERWRLLGPLESINGIVMVGVSTSALLWVIQDTIKVLMQKGESRK